MGKSSAQRTEEAKQKVMDEVYRKEFMKRNALLNLKNLYLMQGVAEKQIRTGNLFNPKDTLELVVLRRHQIKMQISNEIFSLKNNTDFTVTDQEISDIKQEAINELRNPEKYIVMEIIE